MISKLSRLVGAALALALALAGTTATQALAADADKGSTTASLQGADQAWINDPHTHQFYVLT
jgi:hypothetical protein